MEIARVGCVRVGRVRKRGNLDWLEAMTTHAWLVALPALFLLSLVPGPNNLLAASNGLRFGAGPAVLAVAGRIAAFVALIGLTLVGFGALLAVSETAVAVVKWGGVAYLAWLGIQTLRAPPLLAAAGPGTAGPPGLSRRLEEAITLHPWSFWSSLAPLPEAASSWARRRNLSGVIERPSFPETSTFPCLPHSRWRVVRSASASTALGAIFSIGSDACAPVPTILK